MIDMRARVDEQMRQKRAQLMKEIAGIATGTSGRLPHLLFKHVGLVDRTQNTRIFATEGQASGQRWTGLSQSALPSALVRVIYWHNGGSEPPQPVMRYPEIKRDIYGRRKLLAASGDLRRSLTTKKHRHRIERIRGKKMEFGTSIPYARYLHEGRDWVHPWPPIRGMRIHLPARPIVRKSRAQMRELQAAISDVFTQRINELGLGGDRGVGGRQISRTRGASSSGIAAGLRRRRGGG